MADLMAKTPALLTLKTRLYKIVRIGKYETYKHEIDKYISSKYKHLVFFKELLVFIYN